MPIVDLTKGGVSGLPAVDAGGVFVREYELDCSKRNLASADIAQLISVPANTFVQAVMWQVKTAEGAAATATLGDGDDVDGFNIGRGATIDLNALGGNSSGPIGTSAGYTDGKYYPTADTIDLVAGAALDAVVIKVKAIMVPMDF